MFTRQDRRQQLERIRLLSPYLWRCPDDSCDGNPHPGYPSRHARASQRVHGDYVTAWVTGRGFGKTRAAAEFCKARMLADSGHRVGIVAPTHGVARDVCLRGESGLMSVLPPSAVARNGWNASLGELHLMNGSQAKAFSAHTRDDAERIRGYQFHTIWFEELATARFGVLAWDMAAFALRLGDDPRMVVTATPRPVPSIRRLFTDSTIRVVGGHTLDNEANLPAVTVAYLLKKYEHTRLGRQELEGLLLDEVVGALLTSEQLRYVDSPPPLVRVVVGVDPAGGHRKGNDETGIVVVGKSQEGLCYVLEDLSGRYTPEQWAGTVAEAYDRHAADAVVAERNYGGDMVASTLRTAAGEMRVKLVTASRGKVLRAEPVVALYEQAKVRHVGVLDKLESEWLTWIPPGQVEVAADGVETAIEPSDWSPGRIDSCVWAITDLVLQPRRAKSTMSFGGNYT
jgi:phage terminase large subunit-like protein